MDGGDGGPSRATGGDGGPSRATGGEFFLSLPQNRNQSYPPQQSPNIDPVVAAMGPTIHTRQQWSSSNGHDLSSRRPPTSSRSRHSPPYPPNFFLQGFSQNPGNSSQQGSSEDDVRRFGFHQNHNPELMFVPKKPELGLGNGSSTGLGMNRKLESRANSTNSRRMGNYDNHEQVWKGNGGWGRQEHGLAHWSSQEGNYDNRDQVRRGNGGWGRQEHGLAHRSSQEGNYDNREQLRRGNGGWGRQEHDLAHWPSQEMLHQPPGFSSNSQGGRRWNGGNRRRKIENNVGVKNGGFGESSNRAVASIHKSGLTDQFHRPGSNLHSVKAWRTEESLRKLHDENEEITNEHGYYKQDKMRRDVDGSNGNNNKKKGQNSRDKKSGLTDQFDRPGLSTGSNLHQIKASGIEESLLNLHAEIEEIANEHGYYKQVEMRRDVDGSNGNNVEAHSSKESPLTAKVGSIKQKNKKKDRNFRDKKSGLTDQFDRPGLSTGSNLHQIKASGIEESLLNLHAEIEEIANEHGYYKQVEMRRDVDGSNGNNVEAHSSKESPLTAKVGSIKQKNKKKDRNFRDKNSGLTDQFDRPGLSTGSNLHQIKASGIEESLLNLHAEIEEIANEHGYYKQVEMRRDVDGSNGNNVEAHSCKESPLTAKVGSIKQKNKKKGRNFRDKDEMRRDVDGSNGNNDKKKGRNSRGKQYIRADIRGKWLLSQKMGNMKGQKICRSDIDILNAPFLAIYESLIPSEEEKAKQKQLLTLLEKLVSKEWPEAQLYLYGSCANSFAISKSDIDVCLTIDDAEINKSEFLLRLAEILQSDNFHNVQALTRTRVPIVKLMDPVTGISCDLSINNVLAVLNTKLLRDYAQIDVRLQQLSFIVKHWAKSRGVNQTYQGTLSSYAYVLMCIHFLQQRKPAVLPCLQGMETTCSVTVDDVECAYFDRVEKLRGFGSHNKETIAQLVWEFFNYWAYCHDYADTAISVRTGTIISKQSKDWTTWVGNDRHFICIEDPFETSHDLGRPVNLLSIKVLMEEFERAANIMQDDPNPCVKLFEPCVREGRVRVREGRVCEGRLLNV